MFACSWGSPLCLSIFHYNFSSSSNKTKQQRPKYYMKALNCKISTQTGLFDEWIKKNKSKRGNYKSPKKTKNKISPLLYSIYSLLHSAHFQMYHNTKHITWNKSISEWINIRVNKDSAFSIMSFRQTLYLADTSCSFVIFLFILFLIGKLILFLKYMNVLVTSYGWNLRKSKKFTI